MKHEITFPVFGTMKVNDSPWDFVLDRTRKDIIDGREAVKDLPEEMRGFACMDGRCSIRNRDLIAAIVKPYIPVVIWQGNVTTAYLIVRQPNQKYLAFRLMRPIEDSKDIVSFDRGLDVAARSIRYLAPRGTQRLGGHKSGRSGDKLPSTPGSPKKRSLRGPAFRWFNAQEGLAMAKAQEALLNAGVAS